MMNEVLNLENRRTIYDFISKHPGIHMREMERELAMPPGLLSYHLDYMVKRDVLKVEGDGYRKYYFPADRYHMKDRRIISLLRQESYRKIIIHILMQGPSSFRDLQDDLQVSKSTLSYHLKRLASHGLVVVNRQEKESIYRLQDEHCVADLLIALRPSLEKDAIERFSDIWDRLSEGRD